MRGYPASQDLFQALLNHYWDARGKGTPKSIALFPKGYCISYGALIKFAKVPLSPRSAGGPLFEIASFCWPTYKISLHALVVNADTGCPGGELDLDKGYWGSPGASEDIKGWAEIDVRRCYEGEGLPRIAPILPGHS